jgi:Mn2+/Fe2+ NRAMP family transporter
MMSLLGIVLCIWSISTLPLNIVCPLILLLPFMIAITAKFYYPEEKVSTTQLVTMACCYFAMVIYVNPKLS